MMLLKDLHLLFLTLQCLLSVPLMLSEHSDPPVHASFPSVHAFIMLEGTMNLTGETQPLVEQLMMIKRMQVNILVSDKWAIKSVAHIYKLAVQNDKDV